MAIEIVDSTNTPNEGRVIWNDNFVELEGRINEFDPDGLMWVFQAGPPDSSDGFDGDMYFDTTNAVFYGPKAAGEWPAEGVEAGGGGDAMWNPVRVAADVNLTLSGLQTVDDISLVAGDRVLAHSQTTQTQNGIYVVASGAWTRATDANASADFIDGKLVYINAGTVNQTSIWSYRNSNADPFDVGTDIALFYLAGGYATETMWGTTRAATQAEVDAGSTGGSTDAYVRPDTLSNYALINKDSKASVRVATTANITLSGAQTIDGVSVVAGNRVLVKNQTTGSQNGLYLCASGAWTRTTDADTSAKVTPQMVVRVEEGTANGGKAFYLSNTGTVTLGTTALTFADAGGAVSSVFTRTGAVVAASGDYTASQITNTPAGNIAATTAQGAIDELDTEKVSTARTISTTAPLTGGGDLSANRTLAVSAASETASGVAEIATQTETDTGTDDVRIVTALKAATRYLAKAGGTLTGFLTLHADPTSAMHAVTKQYADGLVVGGASPASETVAGIAEIATQTETDTGTDDARIVTPLKAATRFLAKAGGTLTGFLTLHADPSSAMHAVTKQYADGLVIGGASPASETVAGIAEIATQTETDTGTDDARIVTPLKLATRTSTETRAGVVELATDAETQTGTDTARAITPANLSARTGTETRSGVLELATDAETQTGTDTARAITPANLSARSATETRSGIAEVATQTETDTGTDDTRMVTPLKLANYSGLGGGSGFSITSPEYFDDFMSGVGTTGQVGALGWASSGGSTPTGQAAEQHHPGILRRDTATSSGTVTYIQLAATTSTVGSVNPADTFDVTWLIRLNTNDSNTTLRAGLSSTASANPPADGVYAEKLAADTQWFGVTRASSSQTRTAALASTSTAWVKLRIRRVDASTVGFTLDGGTEVTATATIPTAALLPFVQIVNTAAASKTVDIDYFYMKLTSLSR